MENKTLLRERERNRESEFHYFLLFSGDVAAFLLHNSTREWGRGHTVLHTISK